MLCENHISIDYVIPFVNCSDKDWRQSDRAMKSYGYQLE